MSKKGAAPGKGARASTGGDGAFTKGISRRATLLELKGLAEVRAKCQVQRGGPGAVTAEGRPLLKVGHTGDICKEGGGREA